MQRSETNGNLQQACWKGLSRGARRREEEGEIIINGKGSAERGLGLQGKWGEAFEGRSRKKSTRRPPLRYQSVIPALPGGPKSLAEVLTDVVL